MSHGYSSSQILLFAVILLGYEDFKTKAGGHFNQETQHCLNFAKTRKPNEVQVFMATHHLLTWSVGESLADPKSPEAKFSFKANPHILGCKTTLGL